MDNPPPIHVLYLGGVSKLEVVDRTLESKEQAIQMLKFHLGRSQNKMKQQADRRRSDRVLQVGNWVYLKLPSCNKEGLIEPEPVALLDRNMDKKNKAVVVYGLVQWANGTKEDATRELMEDLYAKYVLRLYKLSMERGFLSPKEKGGGRGVKEKRVGSAGGLGSVSSSGSKLEDDTTSKLVENDDGNTVEHNPDSNTTRTSSNANVFSSTDGLDTMLENGPWFIRNNSLILKKWNSDVNLLKEYMDNVSVWVNYHGVPMTAFSEDGLSANSTKLALIEVRADVELKDNIVMAMPKLVGEGFNTLLVLPLWFEKIDKIERLIIEGNVTLVNDEGKPLKKFDFPDEHDSEDEVASVDNDMANFLASKMDGYGTNSLLEQWRESYVNGDYDFDPHDDYMYEDQDIPDKIYAIILISQFVVVERNSL
ncbi:reverse transcriptase [Tanacetum coccineum]